MGAADGDNHNKDEDGLVYRLAEQLNEHRSVAKFENRAGTDSHQTVLAERSVRRHVQDQLRTPST